MSRNDLSNLYRQVIMDHYKNPKNKGLIEDTRYKTIHLNNPSCGDDIHVQALIEGEALKDIRHQGSGCSICCASASVMSETLKNHTLKEAKNTIKAFSKMLMNEPYGDVNLEEAVVFQGVSQFPARIKCATLSWKAIESLLDEHK